MMNLMDGLLAALSRLARSAERVSLRRRLSKMIEGCSEARTCPRPHDVGRLMSSMGWLLVNCSIHHYEYTKRFPVRGGPFTLSVPIDSASWDHRVKMRCLLEEVERLEFGR